MGTDPTYTARQVTIAPITVVDHERKTIEYDGWTFGGVPAEHWHRMAVGVMLLVETQQLSNVVGMGIVQHGAPLSDPDIDWLWRKSDADLDAEHAEMVAGFERRKQEELDAHRDEWTRREAALPKPLRDRLARFRANGGERFELDGWGYELVVSELTAMYAANGGVDDDGVETYARLHGTSGHQHGFARALGAAMAGDPGPVVDIPSALTPLTGDPDYSKAGV